jgi:hypothetical protein
MRDLDRQLHERLHPQEPSWDDDNHPTYVPPVKPWWKKNTEKKEEEEETWDDDNHPTYVPVVTPPWKTPRNKKKKTKIVI